MCRRLGAAAAMVFAMVAPAAVQAQSTEYERRLDSLVTVYRLLDDPTHANTRMRSSSDTTTIHIGPLAVVADRTERTLVESAAPRVDSVLRRVFGSPAAAFRGWIVRLRTDTSRRVSHIISVQDSRGLDMDIAEIAPTARAVSDAIISRAGIIAAQLTDTTFRRWLGDAATIDLAGPTLETWTLAWMAMSGTENRLVASCMKGDLRSCMSGLELVESRDHLHEWYTPEERATLARDGRRASSRANPEWMTACLAGLQAGCDSVFAYDVHHRVPSPISPSTHRAVTELALFVGSAGAGTRLMQSAGTPEQRLVAASGVPIDSLVALWRASLLATHSTPDIANVGALLAALFWAAVMAALALGSSRWR